MKSKVTVLFHEQSNFMAIADLTGGGLPLLTILDDEFTGINPYYSYPYRYLLEHYGFVEIGEL